MILSKEEMGSLLTECAAQPETYNEVANTLWEKLDIHDAVTTLLCTYGIIHLRAGDAMPVPRAIAEWVSVGNGFFRCSNCHEQIYATSTVDLGLHHMYCGCCGYSMYLRPEVYHEINNDGGNQ